MIATLDGRRDQEPVPFVRTWAALRTKYADRAKLLIEAGLVYPKTSAALPTDSPSSAFHQMMFGNRTYRERVFDDPHFHRYRVGLNCTYLQVNRLGMAPRQRMRTCHIAANAVEEVYGIMDEAAALADWVGIVDSGRLLALDTPAALIRRLAMEATLQLTVELAGQDEAARLLEALGRLAGVRRCEQVGAEGTVHSIRLSCTGEAAGMIAPVAAVVAGVGGWLTGSKLR